MFTFNFFFRNQSSNPLIDFYAIILKKNKKSFFNIIFKKPTNSSKYTNDCNISEILKETMILEVKS